jgi:hypothetical protein
MDVEVIKDYQRWADRDYVQPLTCKNHTYHRLLPVQKGGVVILVCPREDYTKEIGAAEYLSIKRKIQMAEFLWQRK